MRTVTFTGDADRDIEGIWVFIAEDNFDAADRVRNQIKADVRKLILHPGIGHTRADSPNPEYRFWKVYSYLIVYRYDDTDLVVLRVIHGARDIGSIIR